MMNFDMITPTLIVIDEYNDPVCRSDNLMTQKASPADGYASMLWRVCHHPMGNIRWCIRWRDGCQAETAAT
jgi:hypothetical protein